MLTGPSPLKTTYRVIKVENWFSTLREDINVYYVEGFINFDGSFNVELFSMLKGVTHADGRINVEKQFSTFEERS
jgi:hypothetical protein